MSDHDTYDLFMGNKAKRHNSSLSEYEHISGEGIKILWSVFRRVSGTDGSSRRV